MLRNTQSKQGKELYQIIRRQRFHRDNCKGNAKELIVFRIYLGQGKKLQTGIFFKD